MREQSCTFYKGFDAKKPLHAYMLCVPGLAAAREGAAFLAKALLCEKLTADGEPCGVCRACKKCVAEMHPDVTVLGRDKVSVEDVRELQSKVYLTPNEGIRKVFVLENIEIFNIQSQNALLKILEEPPKDVVFVLTALSKSGVLPTVLSRVCVLTWENDSSEHLKKEAEALATACQTKAFTHEEKTAFFFAYLTAFEDVVAAEFSAPLAMSAYELVLAYYKGTQPVFTHLLPKKREELLVYFRVFMLFAKTIAIYKLSRGNAPMLPPEEDFRKISIRFSAKRAMEEYEKFENAFLLAEDYANTNALFTAVGR